MSQINKYLWKNAMNVGAILGSSLLILSLLAYVTDWAFFKFFDNMQFLWFTVGIVLGTRHLRDSILEGYISYGKSLGSGILIAIFGGVILALYTYVLKTYIDPQLLEEERIIMEELYLNMGFSADQVELMMENYQKAFTPLTYSIATTMGFGLMGLIISSIASIFLKKEPDPFSNIINDDESEDAPYKFEK